MAKNTSSTWSALGTGIVGTKVQSLYYLPSSSTLYAGGTFTNAGAASVNNIAQYSGGTWSAMGSGSTNNPFMAFAYDSANSILYAGGYINQGSLYLAKWNGSAWSAMATTTNDRVASLAYDSVNGVLYVGGQFTTANAITVNRIAKYTIGTSTWSALGSGFSGGSCLALAYDSANSILYAAGYNGTAYLSKWNGSAWSLVGTGANSTVNALAFDSANNVLYAGGTFTSIGGVTTNFVAKYTVGTSTWSALGTGITGTSVSSLALVNGVLYVGGTFTQAGSVLTNNLAAFNIGTSTWSGCSTDGTGVYALFAY